MRAKHVFGVSPWGRYFLEALEDLADDGRLQRGRAYAGTGAVLELRLDGGTAIARVAGRYAPYYRVSIRFKPLAEAERTRVLKAFAVDPLLLSRVAGGDLPSELIERLAAKGVCLVPRRWADMERSCSCPDDGDPCKHLAAVYYLIAQEIDRDPFALLRLRGVEPERLLNDSCGRLASPGLRPGDASPEAEARTERRAFAAPVAVRLEKPWPAPRESGDPLAGVPGLTAYHAILPAMLPPSRGLSPVDLRAACAALYHEAARAGPGLLEPRLIDAMDGAKARIFAAARFTLSLDARYGASITSAVLGPKPRAGLLAAARAFLACPEREGSPSYRFLRACFAAARAICGAGAFVPDVAVASAATGMSSGEPTSGEPTSLCVVWKPARFSSDVDALLRSLEAAAVAPLGYSVTRGGEPRSQGSPPRADGLVPDRRSTVELLLCAFTTEFVRTLGFRLPSAREDGQIAVRCLFDPAWRDVSAPALRGLPAAIDAWCAVYDLAENRQPLELAVRASRSPLKTPASALEGRPSADEEHEPGYRLSAFVVDGARRSPLYRAARDGGACAGQALAFAAALSNYVPAIGRLGTEPSVELGVKELADFILDAAPLLARFGTALVLPKELRSLARPKPALRAQKRRAANTYLDLATAFSFDWSVAIGDERLSLKDFSALVESGRRLVRWKGLWVRLEPAEAARIMATVAGKKPLGVLEGLRTALSGEVETDGALPAFIDLALGRGGRSDPVPEALLATLRPYQERGFRWLTGYLHSGLGCLLADDMGLGKTVQTIAAMLALKSAGRLERGALVCAPASLLTNWQRELSRFAPSLSLCLYHGPQRRRTGADVTLSSYETAQRDRKRLSTSAWSLVILDEAHYIKNPDSARAKALKSLNADARLALTGTPVENNLSELWSIFDFALPGYLGGRSYFGASYGRPIELDRSEEEAERLRRVSSPFILRRLKTDAEIAPELPDKLVVDEYATLRPAQAALYEAIADEGLARIEAAEPEERLGLVLALITALKQAANHPRNYDKESPGRSDRSGKARLLVAILEAAFEAGERVLVFSQYVEMLGILTGIASEELGVEPLLLHGGMAKRRRDESVDAFQAGHGPGLMLVSLKAGGVGLNLTAATRVIHYDLWWNPAVEAQATDRAYRIGQAKNVFVHRLITRDTIEERIDAMIASKRELSALTVRAGESWIGALSDAELRELVALR